MNYQNHERKSLLQLQFNSIRIIYFQFHLLHDPAKVLGGISMIFPFIICKVKKSVYCKNKSEWGGGGGHPTSPWYMPVMCKRCALEYSHDPNLDMSTYRCAKIMNETHYGVKSSVKSHTVFFLKLLIVFNDAIFFSNKNTILNIRCILKFVWISFLKT